MNVVVRTFTGAARRFNPRPSESRPSSIRGDAAAAPPAFPQSPPGAWPQEDCANEPAGFFACGERNKVWALGARVALVLLFLVASLSSQAEVREVGAVGLTVGDLDRALEFYTKVLPLEKVAEAKPASGAADALLGLSATQLRSAELQLADGHKAYAKCLELCSAGASSCSACIQSCFGPAGATAAEACAKMCDTCAAECEKFGDDQAMKQCAKTCRACAKACREFAKAGA